MDKKNYPLGERLQDAAISKFGKHSAQAKLIEESGMNQATISKIWRGDSKHSVYTPLLAATCDVEALWLAEGKGPKFRESRLDSFQGVREDTEGDFGVYKYKDIHFSAGGGIIPPEESDIVKVPFSLSFFEKLNADPKKCFVATVSGQSMEPTFMDGFSVLVDTEQRDWEKGGIFAFNHSEDCRIKRVNKTMDGRMRISSDNPDKTRFPDEIYDADKYLEIQLLGQIRWHSGFH